jgi:hypothetical protein
MAGRWSEADSGVRLVHHGEVGMTGVTAKIATRRERAQEAKERAAAESVRLGPESLAPAVPDAEAIEIARAAAVLGEERA